MGRPPVARLAIVGPTQSGKTTLLCALGGLGYEKILATPKPPPAVVPARDPRLVRLHQKEWPDSPLVFPTIEFYDMPPISYDPADRQKNVDAIAQARELDGLIAVIRAYDLEGDRKASARREIDRFREELFLEDLAIIERRIERLKADMKKPSKQQDEYKRELEVCERLAADISKGKSDALRNLAPEDEKKIRGFMLLSRKPTVVILNIADADQERFRGETESVPICLKLEAEIVGLGHAERREFMEMYGLSALALESLPMEIYRRMGYAMFFTTGEQEVAGWGMKVGTAAVEAAGKIHTDLQKGFIAAEVLGYSDYEKFGSEREARTKGRVRQEGKGYVMQDADIVEFKHGS
jgi:ribosome-binding ATPase YchF (GTP1/OBG family)